MNGNFDIGIVVIDTLRACELITVAALFIMIF
jgi:hypothetical protein